jgi:hypothetical protein
MTQDAWMVALGVACVVVLLGCVLWIVGDAATYQTVERAERAALKAEQESLIAKHEIAPGITRDNAIVAIGYNLPPLYDLFYDGSGGGAIELSQSKLTREMVIASWGQPNATTSTDYIYAHSTDGEIRVKFYPNGIANMAIVHFSPAFLKKLEPTWTDAQCRQIAAGDLALGMDTTAALIAWGPPHEKKRSVGSWGERTEWVYGSHTSIFFENGVLTSWSE